MDSSLCKTSIIDLEKTEEIRFLIILTIFMKFYDVLNKHKVEIIFHSFCMDQLIVQASRRTEGICPRNITSYTGCPKILFIQFQGLFYIEKHNKKLFYFICFEPFFTPIYIISRPFPKFFANFCFLESTSSEKKKELGRYQCTKGKIFIALVL